MESLSQQEIDRAYMIWRTSYPAGELDEAVAPFLSIINSPRNWIRDVRIALDLTSLEMAQKLNITRSAYSRFERSEQAGCLSLKSIKEIAEAMDCELIYAIRPKRKIKFSQVIWQRLMPKAIEHSWYKTRLKQVKPQALAAVAKWMTEKSI